MDNQRSINELVEEFVSTMDHKGNTRLSYVGNIRRFAKYLEDKNAELMAAAPKGRRNDEEEDKIRFVQAEIAMIPQSKIQLPEDKVATFLKMIDALEEHDDVQNVYHNVDLPDEDEE